MILIFSTINCVFLLAVLKVIVEKSIENEFSVHMLWQMAVIALLLNACTFLLYTLLDFFMKKIEKRRMKNYSLFDWMGEHSWFPLYEELSNHKEFERKKVVENVDKIKNLVRRNFKTKKQLHSLKLLLEVRVESPKLTTFRTAIYAVLLAIITSMLVQYFQGMLSFDESLNIYIIIGSIVFVLLLFMLNYFSKEHDKYHLLLKIVTHCLEEETELNLKEVTIHRKRSTRKATRSD